MAIAILKDSTIIHEVRHDLESFYWLLVWLVLRHTKYRHAMGQATLQTIFGGDSPTSFLVKRGWISDEDELTVDGNEPFNILLRKFRELCKQSYLPAGRITYDDVLAIFKEALGRNDWPSNDKALPYRPTSVPQTGDPKPIHQARPEASIESGRIESLERAHREQSGSAGALPRYLPAYKPIAPLSGQRGIVSESALTVLQSRLPRRYVGTITSRPSTSSENSSTNAPVPPPVMNDPYIPRPMLQYKRGVSDSAAPRLRPSFFPLDPTSPSPIPRTSSMRSIRDASLYSRARQQSLSPDLSDGVEPQSDVYERLSQAGSRPPSSRAGSPESHFSGYTGDEDGSDVGHQHAGRAGRKRSRSPEERDESEVEAGPSKRSRTRSHQSFRGAAVNAAPEESDGRAAHDGRSAKGVADPAGRHRSKRRRRR